MVSTAAVEFMAASCRDVTSLNLTDRCEYVRSEPSCSANMGYINYIEGIYCLFGPQHYVESLLLTVMWLLVLFVALGVTSGDFLTPALFVISKTLRMSQNMAGVTLLAFGNGSPDIFAALAGVRQGSYELVIGGLVGGGIFVTTVVAGSVFLVKPFKLAARPFLRDSVFYFSAGAWAFYLFYTGAITMMHAIGFICLYCAYITVVVVSGIVYQRYLAKEQDRQQRDEEKGCHDEKPPKNGRCFSSRPTLLALAVCRLVLPNRTGAMSCVGSAISPRCLSPGSCAWMQKPASELLADGFALKCTGTFSFGQEKVFRDPRRSRALSPRGVAAKRRIRRFCTFATHIRYTKAVLSNFLDASRFAVLFLLNMTVLGAFVSLLAGLPRESWEEAMSQPVAYSAISYAPLWRFVSVTEASTVPSELTFNGRRHVLDDPERSYVVPIAFRYLKTEPSNDVEVAEKNTVPDPDEGVYYINLGADSLEEEVDVDTLAISIDKPRRASKLDKAPCIAQEEEKSSTGLVLDVINKLLSVNLDEKEKEPFLMYLVSIFKIPVFFTLAITTPVVDLTQKNNNWCRPLNVIHCITVPVLLVFVFGLGKVEIGGVVPLWTVVAAVGALIGVVVLFTSENDKAPKYHFAFAYAGFIVGVVWIYVISMEIVVLLQAVGIVFRISDAILGLTILAWGNGLLDFLANVNIARKGYPRMSISACFGTPCLTLLLGVGIPSIIQLAGTNNVLVLHYTKLITVLFSGLATSLLSSMATMLATRFESKRFYGGVLLAIYFTFLVVAVLVESGLV
ncbi:mitochondrial sodium/calcium exchanger protein [Rhipicephalus sanguineus]|uniref:mitochondrial sodium/calcium exchanger protein n=1 Tax=Rhipicephalus sanguineus TaxID=34632 RepID=UPI0020C4B7C3|nr:mitochondrial sodium/calcium exchanger protein [Rhipicephalus sanguineus]